MSEENGTQPEQPKQAHINVMFTPQGAVLTFPVDVGLPAEMLDNLCEQWIMSRPELLLKVAQAAKKAQQQELQLIQMVRKSRND